MTEQEAMIRFDFIRCALLGGTKPEIIPNEDNVELMDIAVKAMEENLKYRTMENRLKNIYGDCPGLLDLVIEHLEKHDGVDIPEPVFKSRLLTDGMVDKWEAYQAIGTIEECRAAVEKQKEKKPKKTESVGYRYTDTYRCPNCGGNFSGTGIADYCYHCGQKLDWSDEE